jgi:hypothetical protein
MSQNSQDVARVACCSCGALQLRARGVPLRVGMCHCVDCQRRTGSVFGIQAWFPRESVAFLAGTPKVYVRTADSGRTIQFHFCSDCGTTVWWEAEQRPGLIGIAAGTFADATLPAPGFSSYERHRHSWTAHADALPLEHHT